MRLGASSTIAADCQQSASDLFAPWLEKQLAAAVVTDANGLFLAANDHFSALIAAAGNDSSEKCHLRALSELLGLDAACDSHGEDLQKFCEMTQSPDAANCDIRFREIESLHVLMSPQIGVAGDVTHRLWVLRDNSDHHRLQQHAEHSIKMQAISRFAGGMAHEFNNLLTAILGNLELLRSNPHVSVGDAAAGSRIEAAEVAAMRASQLIHELRKFASRDAQVRTCQSVVPVVRRVRKILSGIASDRIAVFHTFADESTLIANICAESLEDALLKLGLNAMEAIGSEPGRIHFDVRVDRNTDNVPQLTIVVSDTGPSVSVDSAETAFEPFAARMPLDSSGLGMAMAYGLTEEMDGTLRLQAAANGNEAILALPLAGDGPDEEGPAHDSSMQAPPRHLRVAVIEEDASIRRVARGMLRLLGHETTSFDDGNTFLKSIGTGESFDLVVLSNVMPGMPGRRTYDDFRRRNTHTPVVICSGRSIDLSSFAEESDRQPDGLLPKPFSIADLSAILARFT